MDIMLQLQMDDIMKETLIIEAFSMSSIFGTYEEQLDGIETKWEQLFRFLSKYKIYGSFICGCDEVNLPWKTYHFGKFHYFLNDWKTEIKSHLIYRIKDFYNKI